MAKLPQTQPNPLTQQGRLIDSGAPNLNGLPDITGAGVFPNVNYVRDSASTALDGRVGMGTFSQRQRTPEPGGTSEGSGRTASDESPQAG